MSTAEALRRAIAAKHRADLAEAEWKGAQAEAWASVRDLSREIGRDDETPPDPWIIDGVVVIPEWNPAYPDRGEILSGISVHNPTDFGTVETLEGR